MIFEEIKAILVEQLGIDPESIQLNSNLEEDLKADSIATVELVMELEQRYNLEIPDDQLSVIKTVQDVVDYIEKNK